MLFNYEEMFAYVEQVLTINGGIKSKKPQLGFRNRFEHIQRVYGWAKRIMEGIVCQKDVVLTAAIFHDCGYTKDETENHNVRGAELFQSYADQNHFPSLFKTQVTDMILKHSDKHLLKDPNTPIELVLLLEADLLDEEGALGLVFDLLAEGYKSPESYHSVFNEIMIHSAHILNQDLMVTPVAKQIWEEKKQFIEQFLKYLKFDLMME